MTELELAEGIRDGLLPWPQRVGGGFLVPLRVTGTGAAYRRARDEFVFRDPSLYLTPEFLERCNGLPVILEHPDKAQLNAEEYADRALGAIVLPYVKGDEVWGVARLFLPDDAVPLLAELSTSPAVVFSPASGNTEIALNDGKTLLIEGEPSLIDHLAICELGVWDKGGMPSGIGSGNGRKADMSEHEEIQKGAKLAAAIPDDELKEDPGTSVKSEVLDKVADSVSKMCDAVAGLSRRMDAIEKTRRDGDDRPGVSAPSSSEGAVADAEKEESEKQAEQLRADAVANQWGEAAPPPLAGERLIAYKVRLAQRHQRYSPEFKELNLGKLAASAPDALDAVLGRIYADSAAASVNILHNSTAGQLVERKVRDAAGRLISTFYGGTGPMRAWQTATPSRPSRGGSSRSARGASTEAATMLTEQDATAAGGDTAAGTDGGATAAPLSVDDVLDIVARLTGAVGALTARVDALEAGNAAVVRLDSAGPPFDAAAARSEEAAKAAAVFKAEHAARALGERIPKTFSAETVLGYRCRLLAAFQRHSEAYREIDIRSIANAAPESLDGIEDHVYADAVAASVLETAPVSLLREVITTDYSGRKIITFEGRDGPRVWMDEFRSVPRRVIGILDPNLIG